MTAMTEQPEGAVERALKMLECMLHASRQKLPDGTHRQQAAEVDARHLTAARAGLAELAALRERERRLRAERDELAAAMVVATAGLARLESKADAILATARSITGDAPEIPNPSGNPQDPQSTAKS